MNRIAMLSWVLVVVGCAPHDPPIESYAAAEQACGSGVCPNGTFCLRPMATACGQGEGQLECAPYPSSCTRDYKPVCGCDNKSYGNGCIAYSYGMSIKSFGLCEGDTPPASATGGVAPAGVGSACGTRGAPACGEGLFCEYGADAQCGATDKPGQCAQPKRACTRDYRPVCGCDGKTYGNACAASAASMSIKHNGACKKETKPQQNACVRAGCSGELCVDEGEELASACLWRDEFACYRSATCERQKNGACGWTPTKTLQACLAKPPKTQ